MKYVSEGAHALAREMEGVLAGLPENSGAIFVSVRAVPEEEGKTTIFEVVLGINRIFEEATGRVLVRSALRRYIESGVDIRERVYRGIARSGGDKGSPRARPPPA